MSFTARKRAYLIAGAVFALLSLALTVLRTFTIYSAVDPETGFYSTPAPYGDTMLFVFAGAALLFGIFFLVFPIRFCTKEEAKNTSPTRLPVPAVRITTGTRMLFPSESIARIFISVFCGFALITFAVLSFLELPLTGADVFLQILAILTGLYFLLQFTPALPLYSYRRTISSVLPLLWSVVLLGYRFLSASRSATGEYHNWQIAALVCIPLFFYTQSLFTLPEKKLYRFRFFCFVGLVGAGAVFIYTIPALILSSFWYYAAFQGYASLYELVSLLAVGLYLAVSVFGAMFSVRKIANEEKLGDPIFDEDGTFAFAPSSEDSEI